MFSKAYFSLLTLAVMLSSTVNGRYVVPEARHYLLSARRFGQEHPKAIDEINAACTDGTCGTLAGQAISTLLAASPECAQQDFADKIVDAAKARTDPKETAAMIAAAISFRKAEKNTPPVFTTNPPTPQNSVFCQKAPKNAELDGLVQAQDPANGDLFFDPATKASVKRGSQANTAPFGQSTSNAAASNSTDTSSVSSASSAVASSTADASSTASSVASATESAAATPTDSADCVAATVTVTVKASEATATASASSSTASSTATNAAVDATTSGNLQTFKATLGGVAAPAVTQVGSSFQVEGNASFNNKQNALVRSCDVLHNKCANAANASGNKGDLTVTACGTEQDQCIAAARATA